MWRKLSYTASFPVQMTADQWQRVKEITADACELEPSQRAGFVTSACKDDSGVCRAALRLVTEGGKAGDGFLADAPLSLRDVLRQSTVVAPYFSIGQVVAGRF